MPLLVALLAALSVLMIFVAVWRLAPRRDDVAARLSAYGETAEAASPPVIQRESWLARRLKGSRTGDRVSSLLAQADLPLTAAEFVLIVAGAAALGFLLGAWRIGTLAGLGLGLLFAVFPILWARRARAKRRRAIVDQLPEVLTLIMGALRAGYGLAQAIDTVAREGPQPSAREYGRVVRATELGLSLPRALDDMARRIASDDIKLLVTAINIQYEVGGNLTTVLNNIADTIRDRIKLLREVRVLTAQQRLTGVILALLPLGLAIVIALMQPGYFAPFFEPGWARIMPVAAGVMMLMGFFVIQRILDIEV